VLAEGVGSPLLSGEPLLPRIADKIEYSKFAASDPKELLKVLKFGERL
jgi:hypothetical protein